MNHDQHETSRGELRANVEDFLGFIAEYPRLALPIGVVAALFVLATVFKTIIDGFAWAYDVWKLRGVFMIVGVAVFTSIVAIRLVSNALAPRPEIRPLPSNYLSRSPTVKWDYRKPVRRPTSYEVRIKNLATGKLTRLEVPARMHQVLIPHQVSGPVDISVLALASKRWRRRSRTVSTSVYRDSVHRIRETGKLRVAVHNDPGEEVFCYYKNGRWQGLDIDFSTLIASELEVDPDINHLIDIEYSFFEWPAIIGAPAKHDVDMAIASITITEPRQKKYGIVFSNPYAESKLGIIAHAGRIPCRASDRSIPLEALNGQLVGVHQETMALSFLETAVQEEQYCNIAIKTAENNDELRELLRDNEVDAVVHDYHRAYTLLEPGMVIAFIEHHLVARAENYGIAFSRVNTSLLHKTNAILVTHQQRIRTALARCIEDLHESILAGAQSERSDPDHPKIDGPINVFVYGTLMFDDVWDALIEEPSERRPARLSGYRRLRIRNEVYPGMIRGVGRVFGQLRLNLSPGVVHRLDRFEAECYRRVVGTVIDENDTEIHAHFYLVKESFREILEKDEWNPSEFERTGLRRFLESYSGFPRGKGRSLPA